MNVKKVGMNELECIFLSMRTRLALLLIFFFTQLAGQRVDPLQPLNSSLDEQNPVLSPDGKTLYFTISNQAQNVGGKKDLGDIWYSHLGSTGWSAPIHGGPKINNTYHNTVAGFSSDGSQLFLMGHYQPGGKPVTTQGLAVSYRSGDVWSDPQNISIPYFKNKTPFQSGYISIDGNVLVYSADSYGTKGAEDIYVALRVNGIWQEPKNAGERINTIMQDVSPSLSVDNKRLFYATNGKKGLGSFDIFYSDRLDDTWLNWSPPVNMGTMVNSEGRELFFREFPSGSYYTSTQSSDGYGDIRFFPSAKTIGDSAIVVIVAPKDTVHKIEHVVYEKPADEESGSTHILGKVLNSKTNAPVPNAVIHFLSTDRVEAITDEAGGYSVELSGVNVYHVKVEAQGFIGSFETMDLHTQLLKDLEINFRIQPLEVGATVNLRSVLFEQSKPVLLPESFDELDMVADFMKENEKLEIELAGHTDNRGRHELNMKLSRERVERVKEYLVSKGISANRITGRGYGGTKPIADNDVDETRRLNRRVEFTILKN